MRSLDATALIHRHVNDHGAVGDVFEHAAGDEAGRGSARNQDRTDD
jgi:hypothetical protein